MKNSFKFKKAPNLKRLFKLKWLEFEYHQFILWYFFSFCLGIIYNFCIYNLSPLFILIGGVMVITCHFIAKSKNQTELHFFSLCLCLFLAGSLVVNLRQDSAPSDKLSVEAIYQVEGIVVKIKPIGSKYQLILQDVCLKRKHQQLKFKHLRVNLAAKYIDSFSSGDVISLRARLFPLQQSVLPGSYNFGFFLDLAGYGATGYAMSAPKIVLSEEAELTVSDYINNLRNKIYQRLLEVCNKNAANFIAALLIGETKGIPPYVANAARNSGIAHILAVSGLHLSLVAIFCFTISLILLGFSNLALNKLNLFRVSGIISIVGSYFYLLISGSNIAAQRAFLMTSTFSIAGIINRRLISLRPVIYAGFVILAARPEYLFHPSFQLSFTAVICLISGYEISSKVARFFRLNSNILEYLKLGLLTNISSSFLTSFCTAPFVIYHFYNFSLASLPMNLVAVPLMSLAIMPLALLSIALMPLGLDYYLLKIVEQLASFIIWLSIAVSSMSWSVIYIGRLSPGAIIWFAIGFCQLCFWQGKIRFLGFAFVLLGFYCYLKQPAIDMIIDSNRQAIGYRDDNGRLVIISKSKLPSFITNYWASWCGQKDVDIRQDRALFSADSTYLLPNGKQIAFNYNSCNYLSDYNINLAGGIRCQSAINFPLKTEAILLWR